MYKFLAPLVMTEFSPRFRGRCINCGYAFNNVDKAPFCSNDCKISCLMAGKVNYNPNTPTEFSEIKHVIYHAKDMGGFESGPLQLKANALQKSKKENTLVRRSSHSGGFQRDPLSTEPIPVPDINSRRNYHSL
mmetsp:Transcript_1384/g.1847  ORF Transcript_1384/g.1847 Transcript_1384/m.1847 type:complete len:133 (+) Transcript_1384:48-446(+)|eukprot:CAMPEP_0171479674 /NCGR_PEP_ID=MMETSP0946-20130122/5580_1 /TAXON_ID=109269 /ORGANISM="Vaucheria litorea, Strain CCMP2940" /LENGTH=132 /DNA_ID=CAMNT_0012010679 /DNA_START=27 /DNA_END=425 /DNA_ORIENTATION=-